MIIDTEKIQRALKEGTAVSVAEKFGMSLQTIKGYRSRKTSTAYMDWKKMSLEKAEEIMEIINMEEEKMKKYYAIFSGTEFDLDNQDGINTNGLDLATTVDRSFDNREEAKKWIASVLKENVWANYAILMKVKEENSYSFDILEVEEFSNED